MSNSPLIGYTKISSKSGWGKLKSGLGWISLDFVKK